MTYGVIVWPFCEWLPCLVIETGYFRWVVGEVVYSAGGKMHPSVGDSAEDYVVCYVYINDESQGVSSCPICESVPPLRNYIRIEHRR